MFEKTGSCALMGLILNHPENRDRDAHERHALANRLSKMSFGELEKEYDALPAASEAATSDGEPPHFNVIDHRLGPSPRRF